MTRVHVMVEPGVVPAHEVLSRLVATATNLGCEVVDARTAEDLDARPLPDRRYDGATTTPEDVPRLDDQLVRVRDYMRDGQWRTPAEIEAGTRSSWASAGARLRDLRKEKFGAYRVDRRSRGRGLFEYRLLPPAPPVEGRLFDGR